MNNIFTTSQRKIQAKQLNKFVGPKEKNIYLFWSPKYESSIYIKLNGKIYMTNDIWAEDDLNYFGWINTFWKKKDFEDPYFEFEKIGTL